MVCPECRADIAEGVKFCTECGSKLVPHCPECGAEHAPGQKFCGECGTRLAVAPAGAPEPAAVVAPARAAELRLVSVLFVDLVGFTPFSESRDAEEVRELLQRYFTVAREIVARYGGVTEKFIGDAVMAVWGVPIAREDDAERAVRAGLEMVDAVTALGEAVGVPELRARGGITTGQTASLANPGEGLVVGDRVNTAARAQSAADPGTVAVDEVTHEVTSRAIAYEYAGERTVKGKAEPLRLWRALRVVAGVGGAQRERGLEAPLVGRDADLRLLKELFHGALERGSARLVAIDGEAGVGKSRLLWEFVKYADGLAETILWHSGRCLSYGDGVAYWALAEMMRQRLGIAEDASLEETAGKLDAGLDRWVADPSDREFLRPRLGALLGVAEPGLARAELFAGWRMFLERLASHLPVVLVFEDLQWAGEGMLDFIEHLLDWSASSPIFILTLCRTGLGATLQGWPAVRRGTTLVQLDPLAEREMGELLDTLVSGLPGRTRRQIIERAEGIPLFAVETIHALASRGVLEQRAGRLEPAGEVADLDVPASLGSLLASRLDALQPAERSLVQAMSVFGATFSRNSALALGGLPAEQLEPVLDALVRKQVLRIRADPLSPDKGQYAFVQGLLRTVAYEMLSRRDRKPRHRAAAEHMRSVFANDGEDVAEVIASHYVEAFRASGPRDEDAPELRREAIAALRRAAHRAAGIGAPDSAERALATAAELADAEPERIELRRLAGEMALQAGHLERAHELLDTAGAEYLAAGQREEAARVAAPDGRALTRLGRNAEAIELLRPALQTLGPEALDADVAELHVVLGHSLLFAGHFAEAEAALESGARIGAQLELPAVLSRALIFKGVICLQDGRVQQARELLRSGLAIAERRGLLGEMLIARGNSGSVEMQWDLPGAADDYAEALALARRQGDRFQESVAAGNLAYSHVLAGRFDEVTTLAEKLLGEFEDRPGAEFLLYPLVIVHTLRGELEHARIRLAAMSAWAEGDDDELRAIEGSLSSRLKLAEGRFEQALAQARQVLEQFIDPLGVSHDAVRNAWPDGVEAALALSRLADADQLVTLLESRPPERVPPYLQLQLARAGALICAARAEHDTVESEFLRVIDGFKGLEYPYWAARAQLDLAAWLLQRGRVDAARPALEDAAETFERLGAHPDLARIRALRAEAETAAGAPSTVIGSGGRALS